MRTPALIQKFWRSTHLEYFSFLLKSKSFFNIYSFLFLAASGLSCSHVGLVILRHHGVPVLQPGNKPELPALERQTANLWTTTRVLKDIFTQSSNKETLSLIVLNVYMSLVWPTANKKRDK